MTARPAQAEQIAVFGKHRFREVSAKLFEQPVHAVLFAVGYGFSVCRFDYRMFEFDADFPGRRFDPALVIRDDRRYVLLAGGLRTGVAASG